MKGRRSQKGFVSLQTLLILASFTLGGGVAVPVWMSRAAAPQGAVIASDMRTIAMVYAQELLESDESSVWSAPRPETAAALSASLKRPVVNQISHSTTIVGGDLPEEGEPAPAVWITASAEMSEQSVAAHSDRLIDLAGTIVVHVDGSSLEVYVVSESGSVKTL